MQVLYMYKINIQQVLSKYFLISNYDVIYFVYYLFTKREIYFRFLATYVMAPTAHVIIYYIGNDGEIIADALDVELEGLLQNFVS